MDHFENEQFLSKTFGRQNREGIRGKSRLPNVQSNVKDKL